MFVDKIDKVPNVLIKEDIFLKDSCFSKFFKMCTQYENFVISLSENGIRTVRLNVPRKKNAMATQMFYDFVKILDDAKNDEKTKIVLITGKKKSIKLKIKFNLYKLY